MNKVEIDSEGTSASLSFYFIFWHDSYNSIVLMTLWLLLVLLLVENDNNEKRAGMSKLLTGKYLDTRKLILYRANFFTLNKCSF